MKYYTANIDGGQGGTETFTADTAAEALVQAISWAEQGDWPKEGFDVDVSVENEDDEDDTAEETIHIQSAEEMMHWQRPLFSCIGDGKKRRRR